MLEKFLFFFEKFLKNHQVEGIMLSWNFSAGVVATEPIFCLEARHAHVLFNKSQGNPGLFGGINILYIYFKEK